MENNEINNVKQMECIICLAYPTDPIVTQCGHIYCWNCIKQWLSDKKENNQRIPRAFVPEAISMHFV